MNNNNIVGANGYFINDSSALNGIAEGFVMPRGNGGNVAFTTIDATDYVDLVGSDTVDLDFRLRNISSGDFNLQVEGEIMALGSGSDSIIRAGNNVTNLYHSRLELMESPHTMAWDNANAYGAVWEYDGADNKARMYTIVAGVPNTIWEVARDSGAFLFNRDIQVNDNGTIGNDSDPTAIQFRTTDVLFNQGIVVDGGAGANTIGNTTYISAAGSPLRLEAAGSTQLILRDTTAAVDYKRYGVQVNGGNLYFNSYNDAWSVTSTMMDMNKDRIDSKILHNFDQGLWIPKNDPTHITLDRTADANIDTTYSLGISYDSATKDYIWMGASASARALRVYENDVIAFQEGVRYDDHWHMSGSLFSQGDADATFRSRHIQGGTSTGTDAYDTLFLNYASNGKGVQIGDSGTDHPLTVYGSTYVSGSLLLGNDDAIYFDGATATKLRSDNLFQFLTDGGSAQTGKFKSIQVSTSYSGTPPDNGILFSTDTNLYRGAANVLYTDDNFRLAGVRFPQILFGDDTFPYIQGDGSTKNSVGVNFNLPDAEGEFYINNATGHVASSINEYSDLMFKFAGNDAARIRTYKVNDFTTTANKDAGLLFSVVNDNVMTDVLDISGTGMTVSGQMFIDSNEIYLQAVSNFYVKSQGDVVIQVGATPAAVATFDEGSITFEQPTYHNYGGSTSGLSAQISAHFGTSGSVEGAIKIHGDVAGKYGMIQQTGNLHIDQVGGDIYIGYYDDCSVRTGGVGQRVVDTQGRMILTSSSGQQAYSYLIAPAGQWSYTRSTSTGQSWDAGVNSNDQSGAYQLRYQGSGTNRYLFPTPSGTKTITTMSDIPNTVYLRFSPSSKILQGGTATYGSLWSYASSYFLSTSTSNYVVCQWWVPIPKGFSKIDHTDIVIRGASGCIFKLSVAAETTKVSTTYSPTWQINTTMSVSPDNYFERVTGESETSTDITLPSGDLMLVQAYISGGIGNNVYANGIILHYA